MVRMWPKAMPPATIANPSQPGTRSQARVCPACGPAPRSRRRTRPPSAIAPAPSPVMRRFRGCGRQVPHHSRTGGKYLSAIWAPQRTRCLICNCPAPVARPIPRVSLSSARGPRETASQGSASRDEAKHTIAVTNNHRTATSAKVGLRPGWRLAPPDRGPIRSSSPRSALQCAALVRCHARFDLTAHVPAGMV
jgi:hypothetical protein